MQSPPLQRRRKEAESTQGFELLVEDEADADSRIRGVFRGVCLARDNCPEPQTARIRDACWSNGCDPGGSAAAGTSANGAIGGHSGGPQCNQWDDSNSV